MIIGLYTFSRIMLEKECKKKRKQKFTQTFVHNCVCLKANLYVLYFFSTVFCFLLLGYRSLSKARNTGSR